MTCALGRNRSALIAALALCARYGMLPDESIKRIRAAVGQQMATDDTLLAEGAEVAFFPPVTGG